MKDYRNFKGNLIHKTAIINWKNLIIGKGNTVGPYVLIGNDPQHPSSKPLGKVIIGNNNIIREFVRINLPTKLKKKTKISNNCYIMSSSIIDHDCFIENNVIFASNVILGGNVYIMQKSQLGIAASIHQNQVIGSYTMIGMSCVITKQNLIYPGYTYVGNPAKKLKKNLFGLSRNNIKKTKLANETIRFKKLRKDW